MSATVTAPAISAPPREAVPYLAAVRSLLADVPAHERDELLDDLSAHLTELAAEPGPPLAERLGAPSAYATEFVASAGLPVAARGPNPPRRWSSWADGWWSTSFVTPTRTLLVEARPGWWVARALLVAIGLVAMLGGGRLVDEAGGWLLAAVLALSLLPVSAAIGRAAVTSGSRWPDRLATAAGIAAAVFCLQALLALPRYVWVESDPVFTSGHLTHPDGAPISNLYAYDRAGNLVEVFLFDQDGRPLEGTAPVGSDGSPIIDDLPLDGNGAPVSNLFPRQQDRVVYGPTGERRERVRPPAVVVPRLDDAEGTTTTTTTTTTTVPPTTDTTLPA